MPVSEKDYKIMSENFTHEKKLSFTAVPDATLDPEFLEWSGRIVGGSTASAGQFRYMVSLRTTGNGRIIIFLSCF